MKNIYIIFLSFLFSVPVFGQISTYYLPGTTYLGCVAGVSEEVVYAGSSNGIWRSSNAGVNWLQVYAGNYVGEISFIGQTGYAFSVGSSSNTNVLKTYDGGLTWNICYSSPDSIHFYRLFAKNENELFATFPGAPEGRISQLYRTINGGITWNVVFEIFIYAFQGVTADNQGNTYVSGSQYWSSSDYINWAWHDSPVIFPHTNTVFANNKLYVGGEVDYNNTFHPSVGYSSDHGVTWNNYIFPDSGICWNISFAPNGKGYLNGTVRYTNYDWIARTTDEGQSWERIFGSETVRIKNVSATDRYVYAVGSSNNTGIIIRYDPLITEIKGHNNSPDEYALSQNYPNPFNPETRINYTIPLNGMVTLKVFDIAGKEITTLVNKYQTAGYYSVDFNASALSSGVYFYRFQIGDHKETKKMTLIK